MKTRDESADRAEDVNRTRADGTREADATDTSGPGDILGISHVEPGGTGEIQPPERGSADQEGNEGRITPLEDEVDLGARDVTKTGRGETGPETGGHGATPQRSGATGTDIGG